MTTVLVREPPASSFFARALGLIYGTLSYLVFLGTFLYAIGFFGGFVVPKTIDDGVAGPLMPTLFLNTLLLGIFAVQHSGMARRGFKAVLTRYVSPVIERSTFVLMSSLALILLFACWQPMPQIVWQVTNPHIAYALRALSVLGWVIVLYSTFFISHFELFGLKQVTLNFVGRVAPSITFKTPGLYRFVRQSEVILRCIEAGEDLRGFRLLDGQMARYGQAFHSDLGPIRYPGDPLASPANTINCRCWREPKVDFLRGVL